ncbi:hypothetical protein ASPZODRAFT_139271 [Penicilliopsis zonata CBS 506.65]|uniref:Uncharacterized protein n=1 Tax=Penicilliopsis zonata CBS 506.65 TaxID=1073090 RepID=A0A1L9SRT3_9EURO|nr:hypothetical protein ASPZODRAFT_139271 [Penicilliopsis zonata CBS 506.65]OJJ49925.1 hypothetical protein ASPZODRAFT_139271 [Penicilliopsis zonata CBS 506.65]
MRCGDGAPVIFAEGLQSASLALLLYPGFCILCVVILIRRVRRQYRERQSPLPSSQDSNKPSHATRPKVMDEEKALPVDESILTVPPLPSACDVLQPLSHMTPLPSSGYIASLRKQAPLGEDGQLLSHEEHTFPPPYDFYRYHSSPGKQSEQSPSSLRPGESQRKEIPEPVEGGIDTHPSTPKHQRFGSSSESHGPGSPSSPGSADTQSIQSVQRLSETSQLMHDVDSVGMRTWKRLTVEYR